MSRFEPGDYALFARHLCRILDRINGGEKYRITWIGKEDAERYKSVIKDYHLEEVDPLFNALLKHEQRIIKMEAFDGKV